MKAVLLLCAVLLITPTPGLSQGNNQCSEPANVTLSDLTGDLLEEVNRHELKPGRKPDGSEVTYTEAEFNHLGQAFKTIVAAFKHALEVILVLGTGSGFANPATGPGLLTFSALILDVYARATARSKFVPTEENIWAKIENRVQATVNHGLNEKQVSDVRQAMSTWSTTLREAENLDAGSLSNIINQKEILFPQGKEFGYSEFWPVAIIRWLLYTTVGYLEYRRHHPPGSCDPVNDNQNQCLPKCALSDELYIARHDVIQAIQSLYRKRYESIKPDKFQLKAKGFWENRWEDLGLLSVGDLSVQFLDLFTMRSIPANLARFRKNALAAKAQILDPLIKELHDNIEPMWKLYNFLVEKLTESKIFCGCENIPTTIPKFFSDTYNPNFFTNGFQSPVNCVLPCADYLLSGETTRTRDFCPNEYFADPSREDIYGRFHWGGERDGVRQPGYGTSSCTKPVFRELIPEDPVKPSWLNLRTVQDDVKNSAPDFTTPPLKKAEKRIMGDDIETVGSVDESSNEITEQKVLKWGAMAARITMKLDGENPEYPWNDWTICPSSHVVSFAINNGLDKKYTNPYDDNEGINVIKLTCDNKRELWSNKTHDKISNNVEKKCKTGYVGASIGTNNMFNFTKGRILRVDALGIVKITLLCKDAAVGEQTIITKKMKPFLDTNNGFKESKMKKCSTEQLICGMRAVTADDKYPENKQGVANVQFKCCNSGQTFKL